MKCFEDVNMVAVEIFCSGGKCVYVCVGGGGGGGEVVRRRCREL